MNESQTMQAHRQPTVRHWRPEPELVTVSSVNEAVAELPELQLTAGHEAERTAQLEGYLANALTLDGQPTRWRVVHAAGPLDVQCQAFALDDARFHRIAYNTEVQLVGQGQGAEDRPQESACLVVPIDGVTELQRGGKTWRLEPGQVYIDPDPTAHNVELAFSEGNRHLLFSFPNRLLRLPNVRGSGLLVLDSDTPGSLSIRSLMEATATSLPRLSAAQRHLTKRAIIELIHLPFADVEQTSGQGTWRVQQAMNDIDQSLHMPELSAARVAERQQVSRRRLDELFVRVLGCTVSAYIADQRLQRAADLLQPDTRGARTVADVAAAVGYLDRARFARSFKDRYGVPPSRFAGPDAPAVDSPCQCHADGSDL